MERWLHTHRALLAWIGSLSVLMFIVTLLAIPLIIALMRPDYFCEVQPADRRFRPRHPFVRVTILIVKNLLGVVLLLAGIAMIVLPGQGVLTILIALTLLSLPGKRSLERRIVRQKHVRRAIDWIRTTANRPPMELTPARNAGS